MIKKVKNPTSPLWTGFQVLIYNLCLHNGRLLLLFSVKIDFYVDERATRAQDPVVRKPINTYPRFKINQGFHCIR